LNSLLLHGDVIASSAAGEGCSKSFVWPIRYDTSWSLQWECHYGSPAHEYVSHVNSAGLLSH